MTFYDLLVVELSAHAAGDGSHDDRKPVMGLAGGNGDQDEKRSESSHDLSP